MKIKEVKLGRGVSFEIDGHWHKLHAEYTVELEEGEKEEKVREEVWDMVDTTLSNKFDKIHDSYQNKN